MKGDKDGDGKLSREEFRRSATMVQAWDNQKEGKLTEAQLSAGIRGSCSRRPGTPGPRSRAVPTAARSRQGHAGPGRRAMACRR